MKPPKISIIVPVYNAEKQLKRCLRSILHQTFENYELFLINDGSTDSSGVICEDFAIEDKRIRVFHKKNGGVSSARNFGLKKAIGEWITFIDSDDWISENHLKSLIKDVDNYTDLIVHSLNTVLPDKTLYGEVRAFNFVFRHNEMIEYFNEFGLTRYGFVWACLFRKKIIHNNNIVFDTNLVFAEDSLFLQEFMSHCKNYIKYTDSHTYFYDRTIEDSATKKRLNIEQSKYLMLKIYNFQKKALKINDIESLEGYKRYNLINLIRFLNAIKSGPYTFKEKHRNLRSIKKKVYKYFINYNVVKSPIKLSFYMLEKRLFIMFLMYNKILHNLIKLKNKLKSA